MSCEPTGRRNDVCSPVPKTWEPSFHVHDTNVSPGPCVCDSDPSTVTFPNPVFDESTPRYGPFDTEWAKCGKDDLISIPLIMGKLSELNGVTEILAKPSLTGGYAVNVMAWFSAPATAYISTFGNVCPSIVRLNLREPGVTYTL